MTTLAPASFLSRIVHEGYGRGAWHGADLRAAIADVAAEQAFCPPAIGRRNIAEIALHHAYCVRSVRARLSGVSAEPFVLEGDDWFPLPSANALTWDKVRTTVDIEQRQLAGLVSQIDVDPAASPLPEDERLALVLGITCHAVYHAGQIQLIKRLASS